MKLRYYLRGLGIGMLVAALVLVLSGNTGGKMSDEEIKVRAAELGMEEKDNAVLSDAAEGGEAATMQENPAQAEAPVENPAEEAAEKPAAAEKPETETDQEPATEKDSETGQGQATEGNARQETNQGTAAEKRKEAEAGGKPEGPEEIAAVKTPADADKTEEEKKADDVAERATEIAERAQEVAESTPGSTVTIVVMSGDSSVSVANKVAEAGLVESAAEFDAFLCRNGYDKRISVGSYEIPDTATEKEIADKITKS